MEKNKTENALPGPIFIGLTHTVYLNYFRNEFKIFLDRFWPFWNDLVQFLPLHFAISFQLVNFADGRFFTF